MILAFAMTALLLVFAWLFFIFWPWIEPHISETQTRATLNSALQDYQNLIQEREFLLENLKDLEQDHQAHKIEEADYESIRSELFGNISETLNRIKSLESSHPLMKSIEKDLESVES